MRPGMAGIKSLCTTCMRTNCEFRYYEDTYIHVATSTPLAFKGGIYAPLQGHLAVTGEPTEMRVMWVSGTS